MIQGFNRHQSRGQIELAGCIIILLSGLGSAPVCGQGKEWPPEIDADIHVYKHASNTDLKLWVLHAETEQTGSGATPPAAIVFFFGGGWQTGTPAQFLPQAKHLQSRGMTAILADYRVGSRQKVKPVACVEDAKSAVRWLRANSGKLRIDPQRICAAGGSAGGHIACCTALLQEFDASSEDLSVSSVPNALALFNPALVLAQIDGVDMDRESQKKLESLKERLGVNPVALSPVHHIRPELPPTIIFHGEADTTVPIDTAREFTERMTSAGNSCTLKSYPDAPHGFFNLRRNEDRPAAARSQQARGNEFWHRETLSQLDQFLVSLGWLSPAESAQQPASR